MTKTLKIVSASGVVIGLIAVGGFSVKRQVKSAEPVRSSIDVSTITVRASEAPSRLSFPGTVRAKLSSTLSAKVMGRVLSVSVREGDKVTAGEVLVRIDSREEQANEMSAQAGLDSSAIDVSTSRLSATMQSQADQAGVLSASARLDAAQAGLSNAKAKLDLVLAGPRQEEREQAHQQVAAAQSQLTLAESGLSRSQRLFDSGVIAKRQLDEAENAYSTAKAAFESAVQAEQIALKGSRPEEVRSAKDSYAQSEAELREAQAGLTQAKALATQSQIQRQAISKAIAHREQAAAGLASARTQLSDATVTAPFDGVVVLRAVDPGTLAAPGTPLITVVSHELQIEVSVPEAQITQISVGTSSDVTLDAAGISTQASVSEIVPTGDPTAHAYIVRLRLPSDRDLKPGMYAEATFRIGTRKGLWVPDSAIVWREGLAFAYVVDRIQASLRVLTVGDRQDGRTEVLSGISEGDHVVASPPENLADGSLVSERETGR